MAKKSQVKRGSRGKAHRLKESLKAVDPETDLANAINYIGAMQFLTVQFMEHFQGGGHPFFDDIREKMQADPSYQPDGYDMARVLAATFHYVALNHGNSGSPEDRREAMINRLMRNDLPDSLAEPDFD